MAKLISHKKKIYILAGLVIVYLLFGLSVYWAVQLGLIQKSEPTPIDYNQGDVIVEKSPRNYYSYLNSAKDFVSNKLTESNGHVNLQFIFYDNVSISYDYDTNSEAISYYLLWNAMGKNKVDFDHSLEFLETYMLHPNHGYMMWRLNSNDEAVGDGSNIASDADLRAIKALLIAEENWGDKKYTNLIDRLASSLEKVAVNDFMLAPYGGSSGEDSTWTAKEVWLSYSDFTVFESLAKRRGEPWKTLSEKMKGIILKSQIRNGLYNSQLTEEGLFGNGIDGGGYSINSMWIMIRSAESNDSQLRASAQKSLDFYSKKYSQDGELYALYSSNGDALSPADTPWAYALVGRAAIALGDRTFAKEMVDRLTDSQITEKNSPLYGAFPEMGRKSVKVSQFTMQESILTLQSYIMSQEKSSVR